MGLSAATTKKQGLEITWITFTLTKTFRNFSHNQLTTFFFPNRKTGKWSWKWFYSKKTGNMSKNLI